ncbi:uncharacterized protein L201_002515 [Kwoniella dendrophila CBS 6074]|uniref:Uncharacterized protein n=1 Tax=Kwoniella dendrophila CBS 6074 TaxID=1295534 RepID=A0AAX4JQD5_9TREE
MAESSSAGASRKERRDVTSSILEANHNRHVRNRNADDREGHDFETILRMPDLTYNRDTASSFQNRTDQRDYTVAPFTTDQPDNEEFLTIDDNNGLFAPPIYSANGTINSDSIYSNDIKLSELPTSSRPNSNPTNDTVIDIDQLTIDNLNNTNNDNNDNTDSTEGHDDISVGNTNSEIDLEENTNTDTTLANYKPYLPYKRFTRPSHISVAEYPKWNDKMIRNRYSMICAAGLLVSGIWMGMTSIDAFGNTESGNENNDGVGNDYTTGTKNHPPSAPFS